MGEARSRFQTASMFNPALEATVQYNLSNDPELLKFRKMRAYAAAASIAICLTGFGVLTAIAPPRAIQVSVNCVDANPAPTFDDAVPSPIGCVTPPQPVMAQAAADAAHLVPASDAKADDPPVPSF
jgi:hypothetical protein